jgi:exopolyphosphatase/guanosine-5'-triphosphate,3'-diphosphate pyrophosphatase
VAQKVFEKTGLKIRIIDGKEESQIILRSIDTLFEKDKNYLTIDVGGGSTEMTVIQNQRAIHSVSFDIGTVRMFDGAVKRENMGNHRKLGAKKHERS